jgi:DNA-binding NarL/FixJ family response regulator
MLSECETDGSLDECIKEGARGVIGVDADIDHFVKALTKVHEGEYWLNRQATSRILSTLGQPPKELSPEQVKINSLTAKEKLVVQAVLQGNGQTLHNTAQDLKISENTLRNHLTSIYSKLGLANRTELFIFAQQHFE